MIFSKYRVNRNIFDSNLFFRFVVCEGPLGFDFNLIHQNSSTNSARDQLGMDLGLKLPSIF